ncbi:MAG: VOC family protein [Rhodospirillales bacterium]|jgi:uncharacterized glyoxalase superfamily protein PhnB|nr:VOC family protein [Rhodospirillales bacterium]
MTDGPMKTTATVIPALRYRDAPAAIDWLCRAFGFERHLVVEGDDGVILHARLSFGSGMVMLGSVREGAHDSMMIQPADTGGSETQCPYVVVADADAHFARALAAGAEVVMEVADQDYGGRLYTCRDPEGHIWNFGTYDPWK